MFSFTLILLCVCVCFFLFFIPNKTAICKNKIPSSSEPQNSHLSSFSVNLTDIFKIIAKHRRKVISKRTHVCNLEIRIEETSLWKARTVIKENVKIANNNIKWGSWTCVVTYWFEKIMDVSTFVLYFQFQIFCGSWFKFLIGNFTVVLIRNFFMLESPNF